MTSNPFTHSHFLHSLWIFHLILFILLSLDTLAQSNHYPKKVKECEVLLTSAKYPEAAKCYSEAFQSNGWNADMPDRLNAARAWAMTGKPDSAYANLFKIVGRLEYGNLEELTTDKCFKPLRSDARWAPLYERVEKNSHTYNNKVKRGEMLFNKGKYAEAAKCYSDGFRYSGWRPFMPDRLNAARAWAMAGTPDSAFFYLFKIAEHGGIDNFEASERADASTTYRYLWGTLTTDQYFKPLQSDPRWNGLCDRAKASKLTMPDVAKTLEEVLRLDQADRMKIDSVTAKFGLKSPELACLWEYIYNQDSLNQITVTRILEKHGWLGAKAVGGSGNTAIFIVVQHMPLVAQEKYLPMMREAVKTGNAKGSDLALLEDRVLTKNGKKQLYGSQVTRDPVTSEIHFCAIEDVDNVDKRRAGVGLGPMVDYARHFGIVWDAAAIEKNKKMAPQVAEKK